jgi:L-ascorbate metabolism protein UlaG (beta-lactamase superfamily)
VIKPKKIKNRFSNPWGVNPSPASKEVIKWAFNRFVHSRHAPVKSKVPPSVYQPKEAFPLSPESTRVTWLGHSSVLVEINNKRILIDPCFSDRLGFYKRLSPVPVEISSLTDIDAVLISHGHHDHCDLKSLKKIISHSGQDILFIVPNGLGKKISSFASAHVVELNWWENYKLNDITLSLVPAQHWHRRSLFDYNKSLWGGWVIEGKHVLYHSGDTGYFEGFKDIRDHFESEIDLAMLPIGAYEPRWLMEKQHMNPDEAIQAFLDLKARNFFSMHWGTFKMADDEISEGPVDLNRSLIERGLSLDPFHVLSPAGSIILEGKEKKVLGEYDPASLY